MTGHPNSSLRLEASLEKLTLSSKKIILTYNPTKASSIKKAKKLVK
jgi:hypothetical protein